MTVAQQFRDTQTLPPLFWEQVARDFENALVQNYPPDAIEKLPARTPWFEAFQDYEIDQKQYGSCLLNLSLFAANQGEIPPIQGSEVSSTLEETPAIGDDFAHV